jgi:hypothetical protein
VGKIILLFILISTNFYTQHKSISVIFPVAHFKGETNIYRGRGHVYVPAYLFEIKFSLNLNGNFKWNKPIALVYYLLSGEKAIMVLNSECRILESNQLYNYGFSYTTKSNCVVDFQIGEFDSERRDIKHYSEVRFIGNSVYLDVSLVK